MVYGRGEIPRVDGITAMLRGVESVSGKTQREVNSEPDFLNGLIRQNPILRQKFISLT